MSNYCQHHNQEYIVGCLECEKALCTACILNKPNCLERGHNLENFPIFILKIRSLEIKDLKKLSDRIPEIQNIMKKEFSAKMKLQAEMDIQEIELKKQTRSILSQSYIKMRQQTFETRLIHNKIFSLYFKYHEKCKRFGLNIADRSKEIIPNKYQDELNSILKTYEKLNAKNLKLLTIRNKLNSVNDSATEIKNDVLTFFKEYNNIDHNFMAHKCINPFNINMFQRILVNTILISKGIEEYFWDILFSFFELLISQSSAKENKQSFLLILKFIKLKKFMENSHNIEGKKKIKYKFQRFGIRNNRIKQAIKALTQKYLISSRHSISYLLLSKIRRINLEKKKCKTGIITAHFKKVIEGFYLTYKFKGNQIKKVTIQLNKQYLEIIKRRRTQKSKSEYKFKVLYKINFLVLNGNFIKIQINLIDKFKKSNQGLFLNSAMRKKDKSLSFHRKSLNSPFLFYLQCGNPEYLHLKNLYSLKVQTYKLSEASWNDSTQYENAIYICGGSKSKDCWKIILSNFQKSNTEILKPNIKMRYFPFLASTPFGLFCIGGGDDNGDMKSCEEFDNATKDWKPFAELNYAAAGVSAIFHYPKYIFSISGRGSTYIERFVKAQNLGKWEVISINTSSQNWSAAIFPINTNDFLYFGGNGYIPSNFHIINIQTNQFKNTGHGFLRIHFYGSKLRYYKGKLHIISGINSQYIIVDFKSISYESHSIDF